MYNGFICDFFFPVILLLIRFWPSAQISEYFALCKFVNINSQVFFFFFFLVPGKEMFLSLLYPLLCTEVVVHLLL